MQSPTSAQTHLDFQSRWIRSVQTESTSMLYLNYKLLLRWLIMCPLHNLSYVLLKSLNSHLISLTIITKKSAHPRHVWTFGGEMATFAVCNFSWVEFTLGVEKYYFRQHAQSLNTDEREGIIAIHNLLLGNCKKTALLEKQKIHNIKCLLGPCKGDCSDLRPTLLPIAQVPALRHLIHW